MINWLAMINNSNGLINDYLGIVLLWSNVYVQSLNCKKFAKSIERLKIMVSLPQTSEIKGSLSFSSFFFLSLVSCIYGNGD